MGIRFHPTRGALTIGQSKGEDCLLLLRNASKDRPAHTPNNITNLQIEQCNLRVHGAMVLLQEQLRSVLLQAACRRIPSVRPRRRRCWQTCSVSSTSSTTIRGGLTMHTCPEACVHDIMMMQGAAAAVHGSRHRRVPQLQVHTGAAFTDLFPTGKHCALITLTLSLEVLPVQKPCRLQRCSRPKMTVKCLSECRARPVPQALHAEDRPVAVLATHRDRRPDGASLSCAFVCILTTLYRDC